MNKKRIIAYALAISGLFSIYKGSYKLGQIIKENYLIESFADSTLNTNETINTITHVNNSLSETTPIEETTPEEITPEETIQDETIPEETIPEETTPTFNPVFIPTFANQDLALFDDNNIVNYMVEKYEKLYVTEIYENKVACVTTDGYYGYTNLNLLETLPETYAEVDISNQKVYCYSQGKLVLTADCVTGIPSYGTTKGTNKGYTQINGKAYDTKLMGDAPAEIFISFNSDAEGFHDARWRSEFGGEIYLTNGSHGCVNMKLEDVKILDKYVKAGDHVLVHK